MAIIKCKMCGGELNLVEDATTAECEYCGSVQTVPKADNEKKLTLFTRADRLRRQCEFDKAAGVYESIVADFPEEAEAYWGLVLCKYGIEYVDDPATGKKIPTCHRSAFDSVMKDSNVELALEYADVVARRIYREETKAIEELRKGIIAVSANEEPYDVFICYKETDFDGKRTLDSTLAMDIYEALTDKGYRVFFSRVSLEDKLGTEYEPYIFAALNSAKIMLVIGTDYEFFNAVWVKNEWSRFLKLMQQDKSKHLIPCYKGIDAYDMPEEFARLQAQDLDKMGAIQDIVRGVQKLLPKEQAAQETVVVQQVVTTQSNPTVDSYLERVSMFLEDGDWKSADEYCEKVLDIDPKNARAYLGKLLAEERLNSIKILKTSGQLFTHLANFKKAVLFADSDLKTELEECCKWEGFKVENGVLTRYNGDQETVVIPEGIEKIGDNSFWEQTENMTYVTIPNSVTCIGEYAFGRNPIVSIEIPDSVTHIGAAAFGDCRELKFARIPDSIVEIGGGVFAGCTKLTDIRFTQNHPRYQMKGRCILDAVEGMVVSGTSIDEIPADGSVTKIGDHAFSFCDNLTSVVIPDWITHIGDHAFEFCKNLESITLPGKITCISDYMFYCCERLASITIPNGVTYIGESAFEECFSLTSVTIPNSVTCIRTWAFCGGGLKSITIPASVTEIEESAFGWRTETYVWPGSYAERWAKENDCIVLEAEECKRLRQEKERQEKERQEMKRRERERIAQERVHKWRESSLCQHCGGTFKGLFSKKCTSCGKLKDY